MLALKFLPPVKALVVAMAAACAMPWAAEPASAQELRFFRIGTGSISGVYFPVAGIIASAVSSPPGARACEVGGSCGVPGLIAVAQATLGSIENVQKIQAGALESALVQADIAAFAQAGKGAFAGKGHVPGLRAIASLYPEAVHIVVRRDSPIKSVGDLAGRRVSLDLAGSGTRALALMVLDAHRVDPAQLKQVNSQIGPAADRIRLGNIDAFFFVGGFPVEAISRLARETPIRLLPIDGSEADALRIRDPFLMPIPVPANTYAGTPALRTVAVRALWVVSDKVGEETVYGLTRALWHVNTRRLLDGGGPVTRRIRPETALTGLSLPLHPGAERYYREEEMLREPERRGE